jgi:hypothetical protein
MAHRSRKSWSAAARRGGFVCRDSLEPESNPCSACSAPVRELESPSAGGQRLGPPSGAYRSRDNGPPDSDNRHSRRLPKPGGLRWPLVPEHALIPSLTGQPVRFLPTGCCALRRTLDYGEQFSSVRRGRDRHNRLLRMGRTALFSSKALLLLLSLGPRCFLSALSHHLIVLRRPAARRCICRQAAHPMRHVRYMFARGSTARA